MAFKYGKPRGYVRDLACWSAEHGGFTNFKVP
jgi:hypothetical protein